MLKHTGAKAPHWKGGKIVKDGYVYVYKPSHPHATSDHYVCEHRLVMEKHLGRKLKPSEAVHHINEDRQDNRVKNLRVYHTYGIHTKANHIHRTRDGRFK